MGTRIRNLKIYILNQLYFNKNFKNKIILINFNEIQFIYIDNKVCGFIFFNVI